MEIALLPNKIAGFSLRAKIETLLNAKSCQRGPGLVAIVINNPLGEDQGGGITRDKLPRLLQHGLGLKLTFITLSGWLAVGLFVSLPARAAPVAPLLPAGLEYDEAPRPWGETFLPKSRPPAQQLLVVDLRGLKPEECIALTCLQGLTSRQQPCLWLARNLQEEEWLGWHRQKGHIKGWKTETNWPALFKQFSRSLKGAIVPDDKLFRGDLLAVNVAACEDLIVATPELAQRLGLEVKFDLRGRFTNYADGLRWLWTHYRSQLNHHLCDFRQPVLLAVGTFDYSLQWRAPMFWISGKKDGLLPGANSAEETQVVAEILSGMAPNAVCVGFPAGIREDEGIGEPPGVELLSRYGKSLVCNNWMVNCSVLSGVRVERLEQPKQPPPPPLERDKTYIALAMSDGDNQILWPAFFKQYFLHPQFGKFPLAFGLGPAIRELQPGVAQWYYEHATPTTEFICDVSGAGYMQPDHFAEAYAARDRARVWSDFLGWTKRLMLSADERSFRTVGGNDDGLARFASALSFCHSIFADMGRYSGVSGITNLTYSLPGGMPVFRAVTTWSYGKDGFLREVREQVGTRRPAFVNGFVHCWTFNMDDLARIHEQRDPDMVFVTPAQLAELYRQAVKNGWQ